MSVFLGRYEFDGPYLSSSKVAAAPGVFAMLCKDADDLYKVEFNHSDNMRATLQECASTEELTVAVLKVSGGFETRAQVVRELRSEYEEPGSQDAHAAA